MSYRGRQYERERQDRLDREERDARRDQLLMIMLAGAGPRVANIAPAVGGLEGPGTVEWGAPRRSRPLPQPPVPIVLMSPEHHAEHSGAAPPLIPSPSSSETGSARSDDTLPLDTILAQADHRVEAVAK